MSKAQLIKPTGEITEIQPANRTDFTLQECYELIKCDMIEIVNLIDGRIMLIDEEGKLKNEFQINEKATELFMKDRQSWSEYVSKMKELYGDKFIFVNTGDDELNDKIVGIVIVCPPEMFR